MKMLMKSFASQLQFSDEDEIAVEKKSTLITMSTIESFYLQVRTISRLKLIF